MRSFFTRPVIAALLFFVVFAIGAGIFFGLRTPTPGAPATTPEIETPASRVTREVIGTSVEGREIESFTYGGGRTRLVFVGGIHGGYEWNSVLLAYAFMDYLDAHSEFIPENISVTVIPSANPDGIYKAVRKEGRFIATDVSAGKSEELGRFNAHAVDLNRNFDCNWKPESMWRGTVVSAGTKPFSEPEAAAIRNFVLKNNPDGVIFWHSQANAVYASECKNGILPETLGIMGAYASGSGYPAISSFDQYEITGDAEGWLASIGIPAITVELKTHKTVEWERNLAGIRTLFEYYSR